MELGFEAKIWSYDIKPRYGAMIWSQDMEPGYNAKIKRISMNKSTDGAQPKQSNNSFCMSLIAMVINWLVNSSVKRQKKNSLS